jgi:hypothetical protein
MFKNLDFKNYLKIIKFKNSNLCLNSPIYTSTATIASLMV